MRLLEYNSASEFSLTKDFVSDDEIPPYAILSHTWKEGQEVTLKDLTDGTGQEKTGYEKIRFCGEQARRDGLQYFWVDTCCIDKSSSTELTEAINSMFRWYREAAKCYVYLSDVSIREYDENDQWAWESTFQKSRWFTRGWTLQELIAPASVEFFSLEGKRLGDKRSLERQVHEITGIAVQALQGHPLSNFNVTERMSWAAKRKTTRKEDEAYSLLGIFDIHMPLIYGEGNKAFIRLREEIDNSLKGSPLSLLPYAVEAPFNSFNRQHEPSCLSGTRIDVLREIDDWADKRDRQHIFWLSGLAGTGKSTIARTVARKYYEQNRLGASFFFSRGGGDVGSAGKFATSIAVQLAYSVPSLQQHICKAITERRDIGNQSLSDQWRQLIVHPLSKLDGNSCQSSYILAVDALDECDDENNIQIILQLLAEARLVKTARLRIFLTSRPEIPIRYSFSQIPDAEHQDFILHNILPALVDHDITILLEYKLGLIGQEYALGASWPGKEVIKRLVQSASGLFIWAATVCRFIHEGRRQFATKRLAQILGESSTSVTAPEKHLDKLYLTVLSHSIHADYTEEEREELCSALRRILGSIVVLSSQLSADALSKLLHVTKQEVVQTLEELHAILDIPEDQTRSLRLHHPSFRDFLIKKDRCSDSNFWVNEKQAHQMLAENCIRLMSKVLKRDICGLGAPGVLATNVSRSQVEQHLLPEVQYACLYWVHHLQKSSMQLHDDNQVHQFLQMHLLHWVEALSLMGNVSEGILAIISLESIAQRSDCPRLYPLIYDMRRFALYCSSAVERAPLQIYSSALVFAPTGSIVRNQFKNQIHRWIQRFPDVQRDWSSLLQTLEHRNVVNIVVFSPNGRQLASASWDGTVRLWDAATGALLHTLEPHALEDDFCYSGDIAFSPDSRQLASSWMDGVVWLWDTASGSLLRTLQRNSDMVHSLAFSPNGRLLASASIDSTAGLWDAATGALLHTVDCVSECFVDDPGRNVTFSPDSRQLATTFDDGTIGLWDAATGELLWILEGLSHAVAFSPDGRQLASLEYTCFRLWDVVKRALLQTLVDHSERLNAMAFSPDGRLVSASLDRTVRIWNAATGALLQTLEGHSMQVKTVVFSPDGRLLASVSHDHTVRLWEAATGALLQTLDGHSVSFSAIAFSPDSKQLASASWDSTVRLWDVAKGAPLRALKGHSGWVRAMALSPDGRQLASASDDRTVRLWDVATGVLLQTLEGHSGCVRVVAFRPDGKQLVSVSDVCKVTSYNGTTGAPDDKAVVAFSPDGKQLAATSRNSMVRLWDASTGAPLHALGGQSSSDYYKVVGLWDVATGAQLHHLWGLYDAVAFSPDSKQLACASILEEVVLWDTVTGTPRTLNSSCARTISPSNKAAVAFSSDGTQLASTSSDRSLRLWNVAMGTLLLKIAVDFSPWWTFMDRWDVDQFDEVLAVAFSPDGKQLASALNDRTVRLWDAATGKQLQTLKVDADVEALTFSSDCSYLQTDRGLVDLVSLCPSIVSSPPTLFRGVFVKEQWIARGMENLLWLPKDYRPSSIAVQGNVVALGHASGGVSILEFEQDSATIGKKKRKKRIAKPTDQESSQKRQKMVHSMA